jgi:hypothetical protein
LKESKGVKMEKNYIYGLIGIAIFLGISFISPYILPVLIILMFIVYNYGKPVYKNYMTRYEKRKYMSSKEWKNLRKIIKIRDKKCVSCGTLKNLEVHHLTYERLGDEKLSDLVVLCRECHQRQHDHYGYSRNTDYSKIV